MDNEAPPLDWDALVHTAIARRRAERLSQRALASLAGVTQPTIVAFEKGHRGVRVSSALAILSVLGLAADKSNPDKGHGTSDGSGYGYGSGGYGSGRGDGSGTG